MAKNKFGNCRCPKCGSKVDILGTCKKCGREWSQSLEEHETSIGLPEGQQYPATIPETTKKAKTAKLKNRKKPPFTDDPAQFKGWEIISTDDETEIIRKRSLMRLDSRKTYSAMALSARAQESQKITLVWLTRLKEFLNEDEQQALIPTFERLKSAFEFLTMVRKAKIAQAVKMEKTLEQAHTAARKIRMAKQTLNQQKEAGLPAAGQDSEGLGLTPVPIDPLLLLEDTEAQLLALEKAKSSKKDTLSP